ATMKATIEVAGYCQGCHIGCRLLQRLHAIVKAAIEAAVKATTGIVGCYEGCHIGCRLLRRLPHRFSTAAKPAT
ncbi:hypothetical protein Tco_1486945, partial [Tanacetum coccineum]